MRLSSISQPTHDKSKLDHSNSHLVRKKHSIQFLRSKAHNHLELLAFLARYKSHEEISLQEIIVEIEKRGTKLKRSEVMILLLEDYLQRDAR